MALQILRTVSSKPTNIARTVAWFHNSCPRLSDNIDDALKIKEAPLVESQLILRTKDMERKKRLSKLITIEEPDDISRISGVPEEHIKGRRVRIAQTVKNSMQSGTDNVGTWNLRFETRERWENPLMGWTSTGDPLSNMNVEFSSPAKAIAFAEKNGWEWFLDEPNKPAPKVKSYGFNFSWDKRSRTSTK